VCDSDESGDEFVPTINERQVAKRYLTTPSSTPLSARSSITPTSIYRQESNNQSTTAIAGTLLVTTIAAPTRGEVELREVAGTDSRRLHQLERQQTTPTWLTHTSRYMVFRESLLSRKLVTSTWGPRRNEGNFAITPVAKPPSRKEVVLWSHGQEKRSSAAENTLYKKSSSKNCDKSPKSAGVNLEIDDNSRKLIAVQTARRKRPAGVDFGGAVQEVEEVEREASRTFASQSQSSCTKGTPSTPHSEEVVHSETSKPESNQIDQPVTLQPTYSG
jgi:hypothetical protein